MIFVFVPQKGKVFANYQKSNIKYMIFEDLLTLFMF